MGSVADGWRDYRDSGSVQDFSAIPFGELAEVAELLRGKAGTNGVAWERPPLALRLWLDGKVVRFCFSSLDFPLCLWGSAKAIDAGLLCVEEALCKGNCDWRKNKSFNNGFTHSKK